MYLYMYIHTHTRHWQYRSYDTHLSLLISQFQILQESLFTDVSQKNEVWLAELGWVLRQSHSVSCLCVHQEKGVGLE